MKQIKVWQFLLFLCTFVIFSDSLSLYKRVIPENHPALADKISVSGFPKPAKSLIACAAQTSALMNTKAFSHSRYDYVNSFNFENGLCEPVKLKFTSMGPAFDESSAVIPEKGWFIHQGCFAKGNKLLK